MEQEIIKKDNTLVIENISVGGNPYIELRLETKYLHDYQELSIELDCDEMKTLRDFINVLIEKVETKELEVCK